MGEGCLDAERPSGDNIVIKAPGDRRSYRFLNLSNGLTALLVHDPEIFPDGPPEASSAEEMEDVTMSGNEDENEDEDDDEDEDGDEDDEVEEVKGEGNGREDDDDEENPVNYPTKKAAAAMCVRLGSFSDPFEAQGLAHFLEHMLFMGSSEYPNENEYDSFLSRHGGSSNAYTETEHTCYYFDVNREHLRGALKRFSQFFISPLIKAEAMEREVLAIDSDSTNSCTLLLEILHWLFKARTMEAGSFRKGILSSKHCLSFHLDSRLLWHYDSGKTLSDVTLYKKTWLWWII